MWSILGNIIDFITDIILFLHNRGVYEPSRRVSIFIWAAILIPLTIFLIRYWLK